MGVTTAMCTSFKGELLGGTHDLDTNTIKIALIKSGESGTYGAATTNYSDVTGNSDEASGTNYSSGGNTLASAAISTSGTTAASGFCTAQDHTETLDDFGDGSFSAYFAPATMDGGGKVSALLTAADANLTTATNASEVKRLIGVFETNSGTQL